MPKTPSGKKYDKTYEEETIQKALDSIKNGMSKKKASEVFNVPRSTLQFRLSDKFTKVSHGPSPILTHDEERALVDWVKDCSRKGFPRRKEDLQASVKDFLDKESRPNPFKDNMPQDGWYYSFLRRNPELTHRTAEGVTASSSNVSERDIRKWFNQIETYLKEKNVYNVLLNPERIYNGDETNFNLCPKNKKVLAPRGAKNVYEIERGPAKSTLTVMFTFSAEGKMVPPMVVYPYKRVPEEVVSSLPVGWKLGKSDNGWMTSELFYEYIANIFYPYLIDNKITFPVILFVDGHTTHLTYHLSQLCTKLNIILVALYPNSTRILQPADVSAFKPIKSDWKKAHIKWNRDNPKQAVTREKFAGVLKTVIDEVKAETLQNGFRTCGLFPWNPEAINYTKCLGISNNAKTDLKKNDKHTRNVKRPEPYDTIDFKTFESIVGAEVLSTLEDNQNDLTNEMKILRDIYQNFKSDQFCDVDNQFGTEHNFQQDIIFQNNQNELEQQDNQPVLFPSENLSLGQKNVEFDFVGLTKDDFDLSQASIIFTSNLTDNLEIQEDLLSLSKDTLVHDFSTKSFSSEKCRVTGDKILNTDQAGEINEIDIFTNGKPVENVEENLNKTTSTNNINIIKDYLSWPGTPQRKGKRNTEKESFVISSSSWKRMKEKKIDAKKEKERKKEERKQKILEKKNVATERKLKIQERKNVTTQKKLKVKTQTENTMEQKAGKATLLCGNEPKVNILSDVKIPHIRQQESHVRFLFRDEMTKIEPDSENDFKDNNRVFKGLCYICVSNIHVNNVGINCLHCVRTFHPQCIRKHNNMPPIVNKFVCTTCAKTRKETN